MEVFRGIHAYGGRVKPCVAAIGNFDGVHLGHQEIFRTAREIAEERHIPFLVYTFDPHPETVLRPQTALEPLTTSEEKLEIFSTLGVDVTVEEPFTPEFMKLEPQEFFEKVLLNGIQARALVVGYDFRFGKQRKGDLVLLKQLCEREKIEFKAVDACMKDSEKISSSAIRNFLRSGDVKAAAHLMGRPFFYRGKVDRGEKRGAKLGFPTANIKPERKLVLPYGVYATRFLVPKAGQRYSSVTNIGVRPTFGDANVVWIESHLLDVSLDLYGQEVEVQFIERIREERRFSGADALKERITKDIQKAREMLVSTP